MSPLRFVPRSRRLSYLLCLCLLLQVLLPAAAGHAAPAPLLTPKSAEAFFDEHIPAYLAQYHIAGATVAVVQGSEVVFTQGYGSAIMPGDASAAGAPAGAPVEVDTTLFRIGSLTKLFTWTSVMQLVDQGKLDLHADVNRYLDFALPATYPQPITLWHLMTHTAGFENRNFGYGAAGEADLQPLEQWAPAHIPARVRPPGAVAAYSNYGTVLAGYIVARVSGVSYEQYIRKHILLPLGMERAIIETIPPPEARAAIAHGYTYDAGAGSFRRAEPPLLQVAPAGAMLATADDMAQFLLAHLGHVPAGAEAPMLAPATLATMHATAFRADPAWPAIDGMALGFFELSRHGEHIVGHVGAAMPSFHSLLALLPARDAGIFVSFNSAGALPLTTGASAILLRDFVNAFVPAPPAQVLMPPADFDARAGALTGTYRFANHPSSSVTTLEKSAELLGGAVTLNAPGDGTLHLHDAWGEKQYVEVAPAHFRQVDAEGRPGDDALVFTLDATGRATAFALGSRSSQTFERLPWYATPATGQAVILACVLVFLSTVAAAGVAVVAQRLGRRQAAATFVLRSLPQRAAVARRLALAAVLCNLLFLVGYAGILLLMSESIALGRVLPLLVVLALPVAAAVLALVSLPYMWWAWRGSFWGLGARLHYTAAVVSLVVFAWVLQQWNLLGWRF